MIIFLSGPDDYRRCERRRFYEEEFSRKYPAAPIERFDGEEEGEVERLREFLRGQSLFALEKMAVLSDGFAFAKELKKILISVQEGKKSVVLITSKDGAPKSMSFLEEEPTLFKEFSHLAGQAWVAFIKKTAAEERVQIDPGAVRLLSRAYEKDSWGLVTELRKLAFVPGGNISLEKAESLGIEETPFFWGVIQGLKGQSTKTRLSSLETLLSKGEPPAKLFNMLASLWVQKMPFFAKNDILIKNGKLDYEEALLDLVTS
ncbi:MAG: hypothetical protein AAB495_03180 [Patescibacteria group bacterium]